MTIAEPFEVREPLLLISIAQTHGEGQDPYHAVQYAWKVDVERARRCNLVLARVGAKVVGAYRPYEWLEATRENFPSREPHSGRWGFYGREAELAVWQYYRKRQVPAHLRTSRGSPIRYSEPE
ncbi:MAG: hypothetical protein OXG33_08070 [Chloroflexi bacterium]|nr:hypothetical protein [Chloroflexota bacterium]